MQVKGTAVLAIVEEVTEAWEDFREAVRQDDRSASKKFWQTLQTLYRSKEYSEDLLHPTSHPGLPLREQRQGTSADSSVTQAEVTEVAGRFLWMCMCSKTLDS